MQEVLAEKSSGHLGAWLTKLILIQLAYPSLLTTNSFHSRDHSYPGPPVASTKHEYYITIIHIIVVLGGTTLHILNSASS